jgi:hypothetical protein
MASAPFNATVQTTVQICGDPSIAPMVIAIAPASYGKQQKFSLSPYGDVELTLSDKDGVIGRARLGVLNSAIREGLIAYPGSLANKYHDAATLKDAALWLADLQTAVTAAQSAIEELLTPEAVAAV